MAIVNDYTALLYGAGYSWSGIGATNTPAIVTYSFEMVAQDYLAASGYSTAAIASFQAFNETDKSYAREALRQWADASGIRFIEVAGGTGEVRFSKINFGFVSGMAGFAGFASPPSRDITSNQAFDHTSGGDVFVNTETANSIHLILHELGHALGFKHPFDGDPTLPPALDNQSNTVMSYTGVRSDMLGPFDIQAVQHMYGGPSSDGTNLASWSWNAATAELTRVGKSTADKIFGTGQRDIIDGAGGNDLVGGFDGNDRLNGGTGIDMLFGGAGADVLAGGRDDDSIYGGLYWGDVKAGLDTADYSSALASVDVDLTARWNGSRFYNAVGADSGIDNLYDIENVTGGGAADLIRGSSAANVLAGGSGDDTLAGLGDDDLLDGGAGADAMEGGLGNDRYVVDNALDRVIEKAGEGLDLVESSVNWSLAGLPEGVDNLTLIGSAAINGRGNELANLITGNGGNNVLDGRLGNDRLVGGAGNDWYYVDALGDQVFETKTIASTIDAGGSDRVYSAVSFNLNVQVGVKFVEQLTLTGTDHVKGTGNGLANTLVGNTGNNVLKGGGGKDVMDGAAGGDRADYSDQTGAVRVTLAAATDASVTVGGVAEDLVCNIEHVGGGSAADTLTGDGLANLLLGGGGNDALAGRAGNDVLLGDAGDDVLIGGADNDVLTGGAGKDQFLFNAALGPSSNLDRISDFSVVDDTIRLENAIFSALGVPGTLASSAFFIGAAAHDANDRIIYDKTTGALSYDSNGSAAGGSTRFANLSAGLSLTPGDFLVV